jgi:hypothetical protein
MIKIFTGKFFSEIEEKVNKFIEEKKVKALSTSIAPMHENYRNQEMHVLVLTYIL